MGPEPAVGAAVIVVRSRTTSKSRSGEGPTALISFCRIDRASSGCCSTVTMSQLLPALDREGPDQGSCAAVPDCSVPQGSPQTGHVGSLQNRPYKGPGKAAQPWLWKSRQSCCLGNRRTIPTFPQPQQQHHLISFNTMRLLRVCWSRESMKKHSRVVCSSANAMAGFQVTPYGRTEGDP